MKHTAILLILCSIAVLFVSSSSVSAQTGSGIIMDSIEVTALMSENGTTFVTFDAEVHNLGSSPLSGVDIRVDSLETELQEATVDSVTTTALAVTRDRYTIVSIVFPEEIAVNGSARVALELSVTDLQSNIQLEATGTHLTGDFLFYIRPLTEFRDLQFTVILPQHASLSQTSVVPIYPAPDSNSTDGYSLRFSWRYPLLQPGQEKVFIIKYRMPNTEPAQVVVGFTLQVFTLLLGFVVGGLTVAMGPRLVQRFRRIGSVRIVGVTAEEDEVLEILREKGGSCNQKDLYQELNMSQSKVSIILTNLEERGLVKRFREGRENIVHILEE